MTLPLEHDAGNIRITPWKMRFSRTPFVTLRREQTVGSRKGPAISCRSSYSANIYLPEFREIGIFWFEITATLPNAGKCC